jgi:hypothetical protein
MRRAAASAAPFACALPAIHQFEAIGAGRRPPFLHNRSVGVPFGRLLGGFDQGRNAGREVVQFRQRQLGGGACEAVNAGGHAVTPFLCNDMAACYLRSLHKTTILHVCMQSCQHVLLGCLFACVHVGMKACKHEVAYGLLALGGGNLDRPYLVTRQTKL